MIFLINNCSDNNKMIYENIDQLLRSIKLKEFLNKPNDDVFFKKFQKMDQHNYLKLLDYKYVDKRIYFINPSNLTINSYIHCLCNISIDISDMNIVKTRYDKKETEVFKELILKDLEKYEKQYN